MSLILPSTIPLCCGWYFEAVMVTIPLFAAQVKIGLVNNFALSLMTCFKVDGSDKDCNKLIVEV